MERYEEDTFEEFDIGLPAASKDVDMTKTSMEKEAAQEDVTEETRTWDDDDIEENFDVMLRKELKIPLTQGSEEALLTEAEYRLEQEKKAEASK